MLEWTFPKSMYVRRGLPPWNVRICAMRSWTACQTSARTSGGADQSFGEILLTARSPIEIVPSVTSSSPATIHIVVVFASRRPDKHHELTVLDV